MTTTSETLAISAALDAAAARLAASGVESPRLDAELLLADLLGIGRAALVARRPEPLPAAALGPFEARVTRRAAREPVAYILGRQEFYGLDLEVTPAVLVPRPETELLVEEALAHLTDRSEPPLPDSRRPCTPPHFGGGSPGHPGEAQPPRGPRPCGCRSGHPAEAEPPRGPRPGAAAPLAADVGTGSGCVAVAVAVHAPRARVVAVDRSEAALEVARRNARRHAVAGQITFVRGDLLSAVAGRLDVVAANLPYVPTREVEGLMPEIRLYEPRAALDGGPDGLVLLGPLVAQAAGRLVPGGLLLLEVALGQADRVADLLRSTGAFSDVSTRRDLAGIERLVRGRTWTGS